jgi:hypothetical protein
MTLAGLTLSASDALLGLMILLAGFGLLVVVLGRRRRKQARFRALQNDRAYWDSFQHSILEAGWNPLAEQTYLEYVGKRIRNRTFGRGVIQWNVYRVNPVEVARHDARTVRSGWFHTLTHFIPRQIRSPWFDHLLEDRERMAAEGRSRRFIASATAVQCASLFLHLMWDRLWELLTPFKPRSR